LSLLGFDIIHDQINEDLLDLNLIDKDRRKGLLKVALDGYGALFRVLLHNSDNFIEYVGNLDIFLDEGLPLEECSNMLHSLVSCTASRIVRSIEEVTSVTFGGAAFNHLFATCAFASTDVLVPG
jgi:hypothetical protein